MERAVTCPHYVCAGEQEPARELEGYSDQPKVMHCGRHDRNEKASLQLKGQGCRASTQGW